MLTSPVNDPQAGRRGLPRASRSMLGFAAGQIVVAQGERLTGVYEVAEGLVGLSLRHLDGRRQITFLAKPGDLLAVPGLQRMAFDAEALCDSRLHLHCHTQVARDPDLGRRLCEQVRAQYDRSLGHVFALGRREARQRLGWFLASFAGGRDSFQLPLSRQDIADYLGLTIETVSREFTRLKRLGAIAYERNGSVSILKPATVAPDLA